MDSCVENDFTLFMKEFEEKEKVKVPFNIKKTLESMGYDRSTISHVDSSILIDEIQETIRTTMSSIILDGDKELFFGKIFKNNPSQFVLFAGHRTIISRLTAFARKDFKFEVSGMSSDSRKRKLDDDVEKNVMSANALIEDWLKKHNLEIMQLSRLKNINSNSQEITGNISCPICRIVFKVHKAKKGSWTLSNFYRHITTEHLEKKVEKKPRNTIKKFLKQNLPGKPSTSKKKQETTEDSQIDLDEVQELSDLEIVVDHPIQQSDSSCSLEADVLGFDVENTHNFNGK